MSLERWQMKYLTAAVLLAPVSPALYAQGLYARWRIGVLPPAGGPNTGVINESSNEAEPVSLLVIGESTVAGLGARDHERALTGQFARHLSRHIGRPVEWHVVGKSGVTTRRTIDELLPQVPERRFDYALVGLGGNDVLKLSSPKKFRRDMTEFLGLLRERTSRPVTFLSNCPMIGMSTSIPQPIKGILWELSKTHDANVRELTAGMERVFYYPQPRELKLEGFFADGVHPSEKGYADWAKAMMEYFAANHEW